MVSKNPVVDSKNLKRGEVWGETDAAVHWAGAFAVYGGHGATASSTIVYEIEPGKRLGWHTDATEETQYIIAGQGKLYLEDGSTWPVGPGSVFVLPTQCATTWKTPARRRFAPSHSSPRRCSPRTSTR
jgi:quercetin dioxygenase-like cupin family protein